MRNLPENSQHVITPIDSLTYEGLIVRIDLL